MGKTPKTTEQSVKDKWDKIYRYLNHDQGDNAEPLACEVLTEFQYLLPPTGSALDVACGPGGNSLFLAARGFMVTAIDISAVAIDYLDAWQRQNITTLCTSIDNDVLHDQRYDLIVVSHYLERNICSALMRALSPGGLLFYQTFTQEKVNPEIGPGNPDYLLASNELLSLFSGLTVLAFADQGTVGAHDSGFRNQSYLVAQRPS